MKRLEKIKIAIIGLGYVGLPLAVEFGKKYSTVGFDINQKRIEQLSLSNDITNECTEEEIKNAKSLSFTSRLEDIEQADVYIITVPTPVDKHFKPDLSPLISASKMLGRVISVGNVVIYESTVYPGATEDDCIPVIEQISGLKYNVDFFAGYSPERINPGDKKNTLTNIQKITSGSNDETADYVDKLYSSIIIAGTHKASSIKVAEAAKVIENTQRDVNIALMNEFAMMFNKMGINTHDVLKAASTKWNFIKLSPGLVGGHCIGVDPYYLLQKANEFNYAPDMIRSAREINNKMSGFIASDILNAMIHRRMVIPGSSVLIMGAAFKEDCPDIRNTKVVELYLALKNYDINVVIYDPNVDPEEFYKEYNINIKASKPRDKFNVIALIVPHKIFLETSNELNNLLLDNGFVYDMKSKLDKQHNFDVVVL